MAFPPIVTATIQSGVLAALANFMAQFFRSYRLDIRIYIDWVAVVQFVVLALITTPPNYLWQEYLEETFPAHEAPAPHQKEKEKEKEKAKRQVGQDKEKPAESRPLNVRNTIIKTLLDQTVGSVFNTTLFAIAMNALAAAMTPLEHETELLNLRLAGRSMDYLFSKGAVDYSRVNWHAAIEQSWRDFWPILSSGWTFWPFVSLINFAFVPTVSMRNLVGGLAGVAWGVYMSGFVAR